MEFDEFFSIKDITMNITNNCNMKCSYCFEHNKNSKNMTIDDAKFILDKCYNNHQKKYSDEQMVVNFFGGEPFLAFDVIENLMKYSEEKKYNISFGVTTNLTILTDHMLDIIEEYELGLLVSCDGIKKIHNRNRCNSYDIVINNIKKILDRGLKYLIEVRMTVMPNDISSMLESIKMLFDLGIDNINPVPVTDTIWTNKDYNNFLIELSRIWEWTIDKYNDESNKRNLSVKLVEDFLEYSLDNYNSEQTKSCLAGSKTSISIGVNGDILPCHQRHTVENNYNNLVFGNIFLNDFKDIDFNRNEKKGFINCNQCIAYNICKGGCPSENLTQNYNSNFMNEIQCKVFICMVMIAKKFQYKILNSKNIRSHRLNVIKQNLYLLDYLQNVVLKYPVNSEKYNSELIEFYEKLVDMESILLPSFKASLNNIITNLVNINNMIFHKKG